MRYGFLQEKMEEQPEQASPESQEKTENHTTETSSSMQKEQTESGIQENANPSISSEEQSEKGKKKKSTQKQKKIWKYIAIGAGVFCIIAIGGVLVYQKVLKPKFGETVEAQLGLKTSKQAGKHNDWELFQEQEGEQTVSPEEKEWLSDVFHAYGKSSNAAKYEEKMLSYQVLPMMEKKETTITAYAVQELHPLRQLEYVDSILYVKIQFDCATEPDTTDIKVWTAQPLDATNFTNTKASSVLVAQHNTAGYGELCDYKADNVLDQDVETAWIEGNKGFGKGASITLWTPKKEKHKIYVFCIKNGYTKTVRTLSKNAQVSEIKVSCKNGSTEKYALQRNVHTMNSDDWFSDCIILDQPQETAEITFTIGDAYAGKDYYEYRYNKGEPDDFLAQGDYMKKHETVRKSCEDTGISEIMLLEDPQELDYIEEEPISTQEEEEPTYESWQDAYTEQINHLGDLMDKYEKNIQLYLDAYDYASKSEFYDADGKLYLPSEGFLRDLDGDDIPELCLTRLEVIDECNYMSQVHVFSLDSQMHIVYCGSFLAEQDLELSQIFKDQESGGVTVALKNIVSDAFDYMLQYNTYVIRKKKLKNIQIFAYEEGGDGEKGYVEVRKNGSSISYDEIDAYIEKVYSKDYVLIKSIDELIHELEN